MSVKGTHGQQDSKYGKKRLAHLDLLPAEDQNCLLRLYHLLIFFKP